MLHDELVNKIKKVCQDKGILQGDFAEKAGLTKQQLSFILTGKTKSIQNKTYYKLKQALEWAESK